MNTLTENDCEVICLGQISLSEALEEFGRYKIWGDQTKACLSAGTRGSLDDTLRRDDELKDLVRGILLRLKNILQTGKS